MPVPSHYYLSEVQPVKCIEIKVPVVLEAVDIESVVDSTLYLPELAIKVDRILVSVRDLKGTPVFVDELKSGDIILVPAGELKRDVTVKKVIISGTLHKQIFYVNKNNEVRHTAEDLTFTKMEELKVPKKVDNKGDVFIQFHNIDVDVNWELQRASRLHQTAVIQLTAKVVEDRQIYVQTCPKPRECPPGNRLRDGAIEVWADPYHPAFWGASNVKQTTKAHSGSFAAELGALNPTLPASLFQMTNRGIVGGREYRLTFWVREDVYGANVSTFNVTGEVVFFDESGIQVSIGTQSLNCAGIPDEAYSQVQFVTPRTPENATSAMVRFSFIPGSGNTNTVKIDDVLLECVPLLME
ncbi:MAG: hypothetical protein PHS52_03975 [Desulfotomaculaceae bacterium]|nr:hypothetical protein [Desulfotomaculaceae bacterium]